MHPLINWLLTEGRLCSSIPKLLQRIGPLLQAETDCSRIWLGTTLLHPQAAGYSWLWEDGTIKKQSYSYTYQAELELIDSPARRLRLGMEQLRCRIPDDEGMRDVKGLFERGFVDFYACSIFFKGEWGGGITYSSRGPFDDVHLELFRSINSALSAVVEALVGTLVTSKLLETYLGTDAGRRVFLGQVKRGDGESLRAVIWFSDIRGFTKMSEQLELEELLSVINDAFEQVVAAVESNGGEVLKFIGDGALAIFPCKDSDLAACTSARKAAIQLLDNLETVQIGVGLHLGTVNYGNIGAPERLDFTVIGPDVNLAARVESQTAQFDKKILATSTLTSSGKWEEVARVNVKGVAEKITLYSPIID